MRDVALNTPNYHPRENPRGVVRNDYEPSRDNPQSRMSGFPTKEPAKHTREERIYIHELLDIKVKDRRGWLDWISGWAEGGARAPEPRFGRNFGVWGTVGFSHRWAEAVNIIECGPKAKFAAFGKGIWEHYYSEDVSRDTWGFAWKGAPGEIRDTQGMDRLICSTAYSPTLEELIANGVKGEFYLHNHIVTRPGEIDDHLERLGREWIPIAERLGLKFVGAYRTLFVNDDAGISIWAAPTWEQWAEFEDRRRTDKEALAWRKEAAAHGVTWDGRMMVPARANALNTGVVLGGPLQ
jgi:hypothetical protein